MKGYFSEPALERFAELAEGLLGVDFSEEGTYDFARCVRSDGTAYGTGGKCRKGTEEEKKDLERRLKSVESLIKNPGTPGEKEAAQAARARIQTRLKELGGSITKETSKSSAVKTPSGIKVDENTRLRIQRNRLEKAMQKAWTTEERDKIGAELDRVQDLLSKKG